MLFIERHAVDITIMPLVHSERIIVKALTNDCSLRLG